MSLFLQSGIGAVSSFKTLFVGTQANTWEEITDNYENIAINWENL